jgi:hypothetical protein
MLQSTQAPEERHVRDSVAANKFRLEKSGVELFTTPPMSL